MSPMQFLFVTQTFFYSLVKSNFSIINQLGIPIDARSPRVAASDEQEIMEGVMEMVNEFAVSAHSKIILVE